MAKQDPVLSAPGASAELTLGDARLALRITSEQTHGAFSVVEFVSRPGEGVGLHVHEREDELVYLLEGRIEVMLGDQRLTVEAGACALLPRGIPHGYVNVGGTPSRLLAVLMPGRLDGFFVGLDRELSSDRPHERGIERLCAAYGLRFVESARS